MPTRKEGMGEDREPSPIRSVPIPGAPISEYAPIDGVEPGSETADVIAKMCRFCGLCGDNSRCRCKAVRYCSKKCQRDDWDEHKLVCTARKITESERVVMRRTGWVDGQNVPVRHPESSDGGPAARHQTPTPPSPPTEVETQLFSLERRIRSMAHELINDGYTRAAADEFDRLVVLYSVTLGKHTDDEEAHNIHFTEMIDSIGNIEGFRHILRRTSTGSLFLADSYSPNL